MMSAVYLVQCFRPSYLMKTFYKKNRYSKPVNHMLLVIVLLIMGDRNALRHKEHLHSFFRAFKINYIA